MIRSEFYGTIHYSKILDRNIEVNNDNEDLIKSLPELQYILIEEIKNDITKKSTSKFNNSNTTREDNA